MKELLKSKIMLSFIVFVMGASYISTLETNNLDTNIANVNEIVINY